MNTNTIHLGKYQASMMDPPLHIESVIDQSGIQWTVSRNGETILFRKDGAARIVHHDFLPNGMYMAEFVS